MISPLTFGQIENCSSDLLISSSVQIELALFNDHLLAWEPLIEPIIDERGIIQSPFTINCQTLQVHTQLSSSTLLFYSIIFRMKPMIMMKKYGENPLYEYLYLLFSVDIYSEKVEKKMPHHRMEKMK